jgi:hypothetical protein
MLPIPRVSDGALPTPGTGRTTFTGGYGNLFSWCAEPMAFLLRNAFGREVLAPVWSTSGVFPAFVHFLTLVFVADPNGSK